MSMAQQRVRGNQGNMLTMVSIAALLLVGMLLFTLSVLSTNRGHMEQRTAAEGAALAAAKGIGQIVINSPEFGFVSLCDMPPTGSTTKAPDNYYCEVRSINELMASARLHLLIANAVGDDFMKQLALAERTKVVKVKDDLVAAVSAALVKGGSANDVNGNPITVFDDAEAVYLKNTAKQSTYVAGSLKLTLGNLDQGISTQIDIPQPNSKASVAAGQSIGGCYVSETDIPVGSTSFVFASTGKQVSLGDPGRFKTSTSLPFSIPAVVRVEGDQEFEDQGRKHKQHFVACATTGSDVVRPTGAALSISFPDGPIPEIATPQQLFTWPEMQKSNADVLTADAGDFPVDTGSKLSSTLPWPAPPWPSSPPTPADAAKLGVFDWIATGGSRVNIDSVLKMQSSKFDAPPKPLTLWEAMDPTLLVPIKIGMIPTGIMHIYTFSPSGNIVYRSKTCKPYPYTVQSHSQLYVESDPDDPLKSALAVSWELKDVAFTLPGGKPKGKTSKKGGKPPKPPKAGPTEVDIEAKDEFDFYMRDEVHHPGLIQGGKHEGESMDIPTVSHTPRLNGEKIRLAEAPTSFKIAKSAQHYEIGGKGSGGSGAPPIVSRQDDFATSTFPKSKGFYSEYSTGSPSGEPRQTYTKNGLGVEIRFRRQIDVGELSVLLGGYDTGYIGEML